MSLWRHLSAPFRRGPRRPLSTRQPKLPVGRPELGLEATDMRLVERVNRQNNALERSFAQKTGTFTDRADLSVRQFNDDETYASVYHRLYIKEK